MASRVVALGGNTRRPSKTLSLIQSVGQQFQAQTNVTVEVFDLLDVGLDFGAATSAHDLSAQALKVIQAVEGASALIVGSPVYKGAYSGHFKHFFDLVDPQSLVNKPVCLTATGGGYRHALVVEHFMRPLFGFFGALALPTSVYAGDQDFSEGVVVDAAVLTRIDRAATELAHHQAATANIPEIAYV